MVPTMILRSLSADDQLYWKLVSPVHRKNKILNKASRVRGYIILGIAYILMTLPELVDESIALIKTFTPQFTLILTGSVFPNCTYLLYFFTLILYSFCRCLVTPTEQTHAMY
ncbi:hypothetical protein QTP88_007092 [Uroleucon formosanum]